MGFSYYDEKGAQSRNEFLRNVKFFKHNLDKYSSHLLARKRSIDFVKNATQDNFLELLGLKYKHKEIIGFKCSARIINPTFILKNMFGAYSSVLAWKLLDVLFPDPDFHYDRLERKIKEELKWRERIEKRLKIKIVIPDVYVRNARNAETLFRMGPYGGYNAPKMRDREWYHNKRKGVIFQIPVVGDIFQRSCLSYDIMTESYLDGDLDSYLVVDVSKNGMELCPIEPNIEIFQKFIDDHNTPNQRQTYYKNDAEFWNLRTNCTFNLTFASLDYVKGFPLWSLKNELECEKV